MGDCRCGHPKWASSAERTLIVRFGNVFNCSNAAHRQFRVLQADGLYLLALFVVCETYPTHYIPISTE